MLYEGDFSPPAGRFALVAARFNALVVDQLVAGALDALRRHGVGDDRVDLVRVPGSFEIPPVAQRLGRSGKYAAVVCLGCVIRGETHHFEQVCAEVARGTAAVALEAGLPVTFGVLTTESLHQAIERAGAKGGNKGWDAALAAIEMVSLFRSLE